ncbi:unnamed protein product [Pleuronectes platessa]|uniref:Neutral ceramidase n=1 Tax=Pleuronectes platessa TaxID=8262 RepID=A0A9N7Z5Z9_PLEPL|nr:unnamed protein product [Pleuronectes platessa]
MAGRRLRDAVQQELQSEGTFKDTEVVIAGLSNVYTHYITTYEEYQVQRYEGASTIYGPHTLTAYVHKFRGLARAIAQDKVSELPVGPQPPLFTKNLFNLLPQAAADKTPVNSSFGDVLQQVDPYYRQGSALDLTLTLQQVDPYYRQGSALDLTLTLQQVDPYYRQGSALDLTLTLTLQQVDPYYRQGDVVSITFVAGNPRHSGDIRDKTFVTVEIYDNRTDSWEVVHTDASWETRFHWLKGSKGRSNTTVEWFVPPSAPGGYYRIKHFGHYKQMKGLRPVITPYEGTSDVFRVSPSFYYQWPPASRCQPPSTVFFFYFSARPSGHELDPSTDLLLL